MLGASTVGKHDSTLRAVLKILIERSGDLNICHRSTTGANFQNFSGHLFSPWAKISDEKSSG